MRLHSTILLFLDPYLYNVSTETFNLFKFTKPVDSITGFFVRATFLIRFKSKFSKEDIL